MSSPGRVVTFGCRLNGWESEVIEAQLARSGIEDVIVFNSCAVTQEAMRQLRQAVRGAKRRYPQARIAVTGCAAQIDSALPAALPFAHIIGNREKLDEKVWRSLPEKTGKPAVRIVSDIMQRRPGEAGAGGFMPAPRRVRAAVRVQTGCDHRCTFCVIPYGRGNACSIPPRRVIRQAQARIEEGAREIVLTGVDLASYGAERGAGGGAGLARLIRILLRRLPEGVRLRLSSLDPAAVGEELTRLFGGEARLAPHLHLSVQAGDDMILKRMKRRHTRRAVIEICARLRAVRPEMAFGADLIAGFPTESAAMHENSLRLIEESNLTFLHVFPFSPHPRTPAARMPQVPMELRRARAARLRERGRRALARHLAGKVGNCGAVLMETARRGRLADHTPVQLTPGAGGAAAPGDVLRARFSAHDGAQLLASPA